MFGQQTAGFGGTTGFGQTQTTGGLFGNTQTTGFGGTGFGGAPGGFGTTGLGQQPQNNPQTPIFGGGGGLGGTTGAFGQPVGGFGQQQTPTGGLFGATASQGLGGGGFGAGFGGASAPMNQGIGGGGFSNFTQAAQKTTFGLGGGTGFGGLGQTQQTQPFGGTHAPFGQTQQNQYGAQGLMGTKPMSSTGIKGFYQLQQPLPPNITSWNVFYQPKQESIGDNKNQAGSTGMFNCIRADPNFALPSAQMLRLADQIMLKSNGTQQGVNFEQISMNEFQQIGPQQYSQFSKLGTGGQPGGFGQQQQPGGFGGQQPGGGLFGQQSQTPGFGGTTTGFGAATQGGLFGKPPGVFGATQGGFGAAAGGIGFGTLGQPQQQQQLGGGGLFGGGGQTTQGGLFGQQKPMATPFGQTQTQQQQPFGGQTGGLFGQPPAGGSGGLFGQQPQQQQQQPGGLFGQPQQQQTPGLFGQQTQQPGGGLFGQTPQPSGQGLFGQQQQQQPQPGGGLFGQQPQQQKQGGLFGQTAQPAAGGGLFGQQQQQQQQPGQGLFGQQPQQQQQQQPGGGLFGQTTPGLGGAAGGGLFGQQTQQQNQGLQLGQQQPAGGGLFGQNKPAGGGLFGQAAQPAAGGGLFGQTTQQPQGGLFGQQQQQQQPTTLFGGAAAPTQGGGLFGQQKPMAGGGLFGQQPQQPQGGLFGAQPIGGGTLFGQQQQQPGQAQMMQGQPTQQPGMIYNPYMNADLRRDPLGLDEFLSKQSPFVNVDEEINKLKEEAQKSKTTLKDLTIVSEMPSISSRQDSYPTYNFAPSEDDQERDDYNKKLMKKFTRYGEQFEAPKYKESKQMFVPGQGYTSNTINSNIKVSQVIISHEKDRLAEELYGKKVPYFDPRTYEKSGSQFFKPQMTYQEKLQSRQMSLRQEQDNIEQPSLDKIQSFEKDIIQIKVNIPPFNNEADKTVPFKIHISRDTKDLYDKVLKILKTDYNFNEDSYAFMLLYKNSVIKKTQSLAEAGIQSNCQVQVAFENLDREYKAPPAETEDQQSRIIQQSVSISPEKKDTELAPKERLPQPPKAGYKTSPDFIDIGRMTLSQLEKVHDFKVFNEFGSIQWEGNTDLTNVDLNEIVTIDKGAAEVYEGEQFQYTKPKEGMKLNKPAIITLHQMELKKYPTQAQKVEALKKICSHSTKEGKPCQFISYDMTTQSFMFRVQHFTRYGFDMDDDEEHSQQEQIEQSSVESQVIIREQDSQIIQDQQQIPMQINTYQKPLMNTSFTYKPLDPTFVTQYQQQQTQKMIPEQQIIQPVSLSKDVLSSISGQGFGKFVRDDEVMSDYSRAGGIKRKIDEQSINESMQAEYQQSQTISLNKRRGEESGFSMTNVQELKKKQENASKLLKIIQTKEENFKAVRKLNDKKLSVADTLKSLKDMGIIKSTPQFKPATFRPHFRPDGSLVVLNSQTNQIKVAQLPIQKSVDNSTLNSTYQGLTNILVNTQNSNLSIEPDTSSHLGHHFLNMSIGEVPLNLGQQQNVKSRYEDPFYQTLLSETMISTLKLKQTPVEMFYFLEEIANYLIQKMSTFKQENHLLRKQLQQEFYVICTLNALFGNPNVHLVQLHPEFKGLRSYERARQTYGVNGDKAFMEADSFVNDKKRRNALTETIRFICQQEFKPENQKKDSSTQQDQIYDLCFHYLLNGDLSGALSHLKAHNKHKFALIISQAFSSTNSSHFIRQEMESHPKLYLKFGKSIQRVLTLLKGEFDCKELGEGQWMRGLCYYLMIKVQPNIELSRVIKTFDQEYYQPQYGSKANHQFPLIYVLAKLQSSMNTPHLIASHLQSFTNIQPLLQPRQQQDYRIQYLVQVVFHSLQKFYLDLDMDKHKDIVITDEKFTESASHYSNQLLRVGDYHQAIAVALSIPQTFSKVKKQIIFQISLLKGKSLIQNTHESRVELNLLETKLKVPVQFLECSRAIAYLYMGMFEKSIDEWLKVKVNHFNQVHDIFMSKIAPLYFHHYPEGTSQTIAELKEHQEKIQQLLNKIKDKNCLQWAQKSEPLLRFLQSLKELESLTLQRQSTDSLQSSSVQDTTAQKEPYVKLISQSLDQYQVKTSFLQRFLWSFLIECDKKIKTERVKHDLKRDNSIPQGYSRFKQTYEPMADLVHLYNDNPSVISKYLDEFAVSSMTIQYCHQVKVDQ